MQNLSDSELDNVFRKASQQYGAEIDGSSNWQEMAQRLDASDKVSGVRKSLTFVLIGSLIMLSLFKDSTTFDDADLVNITNEQPTSEIKLTEINEIVSKDIGKVSGNVEMPIPKTIFIQPYSNQKEPTEIYTKTIAPEIPVELMNSEELINNETSKRSIGLIEPSDSKDIADEKQIETPEESTKSDRNESVDAPILMDPGLGGNRRFGFKVSISPDFSSVGYSPTDKPGWNYGVLLEYQFSNHWSLSTGVIRSRKIYSTSGIEYFGYKADDVQGDCRIWDIPINVYYTFTPKGKWSIFTGIGISSYLMSKENYVYTVSTYYGPKQYDLEVEGKNKEWFKMLNLSVGVQRQLSNNFAFQVEPFLKAPLAGVGEGDVSLASLGAFFSLKYKFTKKPKN